MELDQDFTPIRRYTYGIGKDSVEGHIEFSEASSNLFAHPYGWYSYIKDQVGTIYKIHSHQTHSTVTTRHYDTFGNLLSQSGPTKGKLGFHSKYFDQESGLNYFYHRYYNSGVGRFISEDPIGFQGGLNFNASFENDPVGNIDPYGEQVPRSYNKAIWFWGGMQAGNKYVKRVSHYADTETTGPIWDVTKWTLQGIYSKKTGCCLYGFAKCMGIPDFSKSESVISGVLTYWQILGWRYPANVQDFKYLGKTAVLFNWKWVIKKLGKKLAKGLGTLGLIFTINEYRRCWLEMKSCMGW